MVSVASWVGAVDGVAVKPASMDLDTVATLSVDRVIVDFEGVASFPEPATLRYLARDRTVRVTVPVRADGFDPCGDNHLARTIPTTVERVLVAGHPAYLDERGRRRAIGPRLVAAADATPEPWVGTAGVERLALAVGGTQFELLGPTTEPTVLALRGAGVTTDIAVYAPVVPATDDDTILDAIGAYVARRPTVRDRIPADAPTDADAMSRVRTALLDAAEDVALVGDTATIVHRIEALHAVGVDSVIAYPAIGLDSIQQ
ncbi:MAG: luciferase [Halobacteriaceae archaeon]